jgi:indole-3-glycerol phosphate synthase
LLEYLGKMNNVRDDCVVVSESGISKRKDIDRFYGLGAGAFLVGGSLMDEKVNPTLEHMRRATCMLTGKEYVPLRQ